MATAKQQGRWQAKRKRPDPSPSEINVTSSWAKLLADRVATRPAVRLGAHDVWLVDGLFSSEECATLLSCAEAHGFGTTHYDPAYRGNLRLTTTDSSLADAVWMRLRPAVPPTLVLRKPECEFDRGELWWEQYPEAEGEWEACGLNECWRLTKYRAGDRFLTHCDEAYVRHNSSGGSGGDEMSMFTVNIYMNDDFEAGRTRFFFRDAWWEQLSVVPAGGRTSSGAERGSVGYLLKESAEADETVVPAAGRCLLFRQPPGRSYYHDGEEVGSGCKYLFRTDVMYRKVASLDAAGAPRTRPRSRSETEKPL